MLASFTRQALARTVARSVPVRSLSTAGIWGHLEPTPADPILGLTAAFKVDEHPNKVNLSQGAYRDDNGNPYVLECVHEAERRILARTSLDKEYLPVEGHAQFRALTRDFVLGSDSAGINPDQVAVLQTLSGTGALRVAGAFIQQSLPADVPRKIYVSSPTWGNHHNIFRESGLQVEPYTYLDEAGTGLDFAGLVKDLEALPAGSCVLLHACAHNPTGVDPSHEQWDQLAQLFKDKKLVPFFDSAYQGYASGDADHDAYSIRSFVRAGLHPLIAQSYAKNLGLYGERVGALNVVCPSKDQADVVLGHLKQKVVRPMYSSPPLHGALIAAEVLGDPELRESWRVELSNMAARVASMRRALRNALEAQGTPNEQGAVDWAHITDQIGMFAFTGLSEKSVNKLLDEQHLYMTKDGRMNIAGLFSSNVDSVAKALHSVLTNK